MTAGVGVFFDLGRRQTRKEQKAAMKGSGGWRGAVGGALWLGATKFMGVGGWTLCFSDEVVPPYPGGILERLTFWLWLHMHTIQSFEPPAVKRELLWLLPTCVCARVVFWRRLPRGGGRGGGSGRRE